MGGSTLEITYAACCVLCSGIGAVYDVRSRRIPNAFTLPAMLFGLLVHYQLGGFKQMGAAAAAGLACGSIFLLFHLAGGMGAGDVKLITAAGCSAGLWQVGPLLLFTSLAGGVLALAVATYHRRLKATLSNVRTIAVHHGSAGITPHPEFNLGNPQTLRLPYAVAIAAGSLLSLCLQVVRR